jgi:hypothetical protein
MKKIKIQSKNGKIKIFIAMCLMIWVGIFCVGQDASPWSLNHCFESNDTMSQLSNLFNYSIQCSRKPFEKRLKKRRNWFEVLFNPIHFFKVWWHAANLFLFIFTLIEQTYIIYIYYLSTWYLSSTLFLSSWLPLGRGPPLGCRADIITRACLTASRRATV